MEELWETEETKENENNLGCPRLDPEIENGH